jgi:hypothetical protein
MKKRFSFAAIKKRENPKNLYKNQSRGRNDEKPTSSQNEFYLFYKPFNYY